MSKLSIIIPVSLMIPVRLYEPPFALGDKVKLKISLTKEVVGASLSVVVFLA